MSSQGELYIVDKKVLPEVFGKVLEAKKLIETGAVASVQEAAERVGVSRSAYYKYKDSVFRLGENARGRTATIAFNLPDKAGALSTVLNIIASSGANILTINQTIPINAVANLTISLTTDNITDGLTNLVEQIANIQGVQALKIIARE
jgi:chorismate mutase